MNIFIKLNKLTNLTENEKILVIYMQDNPESFVKMSTLEISEACFISIATIYRLCPKLDLDGFPYKAWLDKLSEEKICIEQPFYCKYGKNIEVGNNVWVGF